MSARLWNYGDSWAAGAGVEKQDTYAYRIAEMLGLEFQDVSRNGRSLMEIESLIYKNLSEKTSDDIILITVPPDTRWITPKSPGMETTNFDFRTLLDTRKEDTLLYEGFLKSINHSVKWFIYQHCRAITAIIHACKLHNIKLYLQHNCGNIESHPFFDQDLIRKYFLDYDNSMWNWLGFEQTGVNEISGETLPKEFQNYDHGLRQGPYAVKPNQYALPDDNHPNSLGHTLIAEKIYEFIRNK